MMTVADMTDDLDVTWTMTVWVAEEAVVLPHPHLLVKVHDKRRHTMVDSHILNPIEDHTTEVTVEATEDMVNINSQFAVLLHGVNRRGEKHRTKLASDKSKISGAELKARHK